MRGHLTLLQQLTRRAYPHIIPLRPLLQQSLLALLQHSQLSALNTGEPVSEAASDGGVDGVGPEVGAAEERAHLDAELP